MRFWTTVVLQIALCGAFLCDAQTLNGIDVSNYQGSIDWNAVAKSGVSFGMTKATEGVDYLDPTLAANWAGMQAAGLVRGAYHFGHPGTDAVAQANFFVTAVQNAGGFVNSSTMQLMLDLEVTDGQSPAAVWAWVQTFMATIEQLTGRPGIIYTGFYFWQDNVGNPSDNLNAPLWLAAYVANPQVPAAWGYWTFWQYSDTGSVPGIAGNVDVDYFAGTIDNLQRELGNL